MKKLPQIGLGIYCLLLLAACRHPLPVFEDSLLPVWENGKWGYIDNQGNKVIQPQFAYAMPFSEGLGGVNYGGSGYEKDMPENGKWGFVNRRNEIVINPRYFPPPVYAAPYDWEEVALAAHEAYIFSEGLALVRTKDDWEYIDTLGRTQISLLSIKSGRRFSEGLAAVYIGDKWGYIDKNGNIAIKPQFLFPANFEDGFAYVMDSDMKTYCIDRTGKKILSQYRFAGNFQEAHAAVKGGYRGDKFDISENLTMGLIDTSGFLVAKPEFDQVGQYGSGLAPVLVGSEKPKLLTLNDDFKTLKYAGGKWGYINDSGKFLINPQFEDAKGFSQGIAAVKLNGLWGYIQPDGRWLFEPQFQWAGSFEKSGTAKVILSSKHHPDTGKTAYLNTDKIIWIEP